MEWANKNFKRFKYAPPLKGKRVIMREMEVNKQEPKGTPGDFFFLTKRLR